MTPLLAFAQTTTYELTPSTERLPPFLWTTFTVLNNIHGIWRWYRRVELYRNPENLAQLLAGHLVNLAIGDLLILRIAAQCLLISTRVLECAQQQTRLYQAGLQWVVAVNNHYPKPNRISWSKQQTYTWLSPSSTDWLKIKTFSLRNRLERIVKCTAIIFLNFFKLSMCLMDAIDAFCLSPHTRNEGINEGFVNTMKWLDNLVENKEELLKGMAKNQAIIERILRGSPLSYAQLHNGVSKTLEKTENFYQNAKKISDFSNGIIIKLSKKMVNGCMVMTGLSSFRPTALA